MTRFEQLTKFLDEVYLCISEAIELMNDDPERSRRTLRAIRQDLLTVTELVKALTPSDLR